MKDSLLNKLIYAFLIREGFLQEFMRVYRQVIPNSRSEYGIYTNFLIRFSDLDRCYNTYGTLGTPKKLFNAPRLRLYCDFSWEDIKRWWGISRKWEDFYSKNHLFTKCHCHMDNRYKVVLESDDIDYERLCEMHMGDC